MRETYGYGALLLGVMRLMPNSDKTASLAAESTRATTPRKVGIVLLQLALPGHQVLPTGVLLLDFAVDRLYSEINFLVDDADASEILSSLTEEFDAMSKERGGGVGLDYLRETLSNTLQVGDLEELLILNHPAAAVKQIFAERVTPFVDAGLESSYRFDSLARQVLVIEDNPPDVMLIKEALCEYSSATAVTVATDGDQALRLLDTIAIPFTGPDCVLLGLTGCGKMEI